MNLAIIFVVFAALALMLILSITVTRKLQASPSRSLATEIRPIDIEAFRNLVDPAEEAYLRRRLRGAEFRSVQRERLRAMAAYVRAAKRNAAVLVSVGQRALAAGDAHTVEAARELINSAVLLQHNAAFALFRIRVASAWPSSNLTAAPLVHGYEHLNRSAMLLGRLQNPAVPVRIAAR